MDFLVIAIIIFSAILHEIMHGWVADKLGDPTARLMGRLTLDPRPHIDPIMSVLVPTLLYFMTGGRFIFAAAKPVPVNPLNLKDGKKDMALVALAGPLTNILLGVIPAIMLNIFSPSSLLLNNFILQVIVLNLSLGIFNLIPIPPLDGSKILANFIPNEYLHAYLSLERFGIFLLIFLLYFPIGPFSLGDLLNQLILGCLRLLGIY